ncbi:MAG: class I SAM-dependent methyltransferase [Paludibacteraceae bacterium]
MDNLFIKNSVAETLLIPLYMRAKESMRGDKAILRDTDAAKLVEMIPYDYSKFDGAKLSEVGCNVRAWYLDNVVRDFIEANSNPVIVNVGCGLDTRAQRIGSQSSVKYYSLDLPEVIETRAAILPETKNETYISSSMFDEKWMEELKSTHPDASFLFIIEGVLMYFDEVKVKGLFKSFLKYFPGAEIWFDLCGSITVKQQKRHDSVKNLSARFHWGLDNGREIEKWDEHIKMIRQSSQGLFFKYRYPFFMRIIAAFPKLLFKFCSIVGYKLS